MKSRYVSSTKFSEIVGRLYQHGSRRQAEGLFMRLSQRIELGGSERIVVDLKALLFLLEIANGDSRRGFIDKTSTVATNVEFWNQRECQGRSPSTPSPRKHNIVSSKGFLFEEGFNSPPRSSVASLMNTRTVDCRSTPNRGR
jgi:hypothetical protein